MKKISLSLYLLALFLDRGLLEAQPLLPNPVYGLQAAVNWDLQYANGDEFGTGIEDGTPYQGTATLGFMEGVPSGFTWYLPDARPQPIQPPSTWSSAFIGATSLHAYDQIYKFNGTPAHPNCRVELGPMRFMVHLISSGQWVDITSTVGPFSGAAFVEDFDNNESTGPDVENWSNGVFSVRSGIGNAFPSDLGGPGGVDSRGVGFMFHGFPGPQPTISGTLASIDAALAFQQIRCVGPDSQYTPYLCNVGIDYAEETGVSGGLFVPATTNWQWYTCYVGPVSEISSIPEPNANYVFITNITVTPGSVSLAGSTSTQLTASVSPSNASDPGIHWFTSNTNAVYVNPVTGVALAVGQGTATISAAAQENWNTVGNCTLTVTSAPPWTVVNVGNSSDGITYNDGGFFFHDVQAIGQDIRYMNETGGTAQYQFTGTGVEVIGKLYGSEGPTCNYTIAVDGTVYYSGTDSSPSGNDEYEAVLGSVTGLSNGSHTVTITQTSGGNYASFLLLDALFIYGSGGPAVTGVSVSPTSFTLGVSSTRQLTSTVSPANASNPNVTWSSGNGAVATVNTTGLVTGTGVGTTTITATTQDGGYTASSTVTVTPSVYVTDYATNRGSGLNQFNYFGSGQYAWYNNGAIIQDQNLNDYATLQFYGTHVEVYCDEGHYDGIVAASLDGGNEAFFSTFNANATGSTLVYTSPRLALGNHTLKLRNTGETYGYPAQDFFIQLDHVNAFNNDTVVDPPIPPLTVVTNNAFTPIYAGNNELNQYYLTLAYQTDASGNYIFSWTQDGAYAGYWVNFGAGASQVSFLTELDGVSDFDPPAGGTVNVCLGSPSGTVVGTCTIPNGTQNVWNTYTANLNTTLTGIQQIYLTFHQAQSGSGLFDLDYFQFAGSSGSTNGTTIVNAGNASDGITYDSSSSSWFNTRSGDINSDERMMSAAGDYAQYTFTGTGVDVIGFLPGGSQYAANFTIYVDGVAKVTGTTTASSDTYQTVLGSVTGLSSGTHTVKLAFTSGIGSSPYVILDAFRIYNSNGSVVRVTGVSVSPTSASINVGGTTNLTATVAPANATTNTVTWSSSNTGVATVSSSGLVTGVAAGSATITVTTQDGGKTANSAITVTVPVVRVTGVSVSPTSASINVGGTTNLTATVIPSNATTNTVTWSSSNTGVATVNSSGLVTGVAAGSATITVTTQDSGKTATSAITVTGTSSTIVNAGNASDGITYSGGWFNTRTGDINNDERMMNSSSCYAQYTFTGTGVDVIGFEAGGSYGANFTIYIDGNSVATGNTTSSTDQYQVVLGSATGLSNGSHTVKIAFTSGIGSSPYVILDAFKIYTGSTVAVTGVSVSPTSASLNRGATTQLTATVSPSNASNQNVSWTSSNTGVATVSSSGLVTGVAAGSATITVTTQDGGKTATSAITVTTANVPVTGVSVSPTSASVTVGATTQLTATVSPSNASNQNVSWTSSNTGVATVSSSGLVTGVAAGSATITVTTQDGSKTATSAITVTNSSGADLALNKSYAAGSANYSSIGLAFDGSTSTGVSGTANYGGNGVLAADLGATTTISKVTVTFGDVVPYQVQGSSDGTNWSNIGAKVTSPSNPNTTTYSGVSYRYVRVVFDAFYVGGVGYFNPGINEIGVY